MFISQFSKKQFGPYITPVKLVIKKRPMSYVNGDGKRAFGWEIEKEILVAPEEVAAAMLKYPCPDPADLMPADGKPIKSVVATPRRREFRRDRDDDRRDRY
jgi:hypothetical protein